MNIYVLHIGMTKQETSPRVESRTVRTGRRRAVDIDSPRDQTVCFMLSAEEKAEVDALSMASNLTRSAILAKLTTLFLAGTAGGKKGHQSESELLEFLVDSRKARRKHAPLFK
jgi:hypothetical protein